MLLPNFPQNSTNNGTVEHVHKLQVKFKEMIAANMIDSITNTLLKTYKLPLYWKEFIKRSLIHVSNIQHLVDNNNNSKNINISEEEYTNFLDAIAFATSSHQDDIDLVIMRCFASEASKLVFEGLV